MNGTLAAETPLLRTVLKGEWGFDGLVVSDWGAVRSVEASANGGTDPGDAGPCTRWSEELLAAVRAGRVSESAVDDKVLRLLRLAARVGPLDGLPPLVDPASLDTPPQPDAPEVQELLRRPGTLGTVLLRNEGGVLPLDPGSLERVAVIRPAASQPRSNGGGSAAVIPSCSVTRCGRSVRRWRTPRSCTPKGHGPAPWSAGLRRRARSRRERGGGAGRVRRRRGAGPRLGSPQPSQHARLRHGPARRRAGLSGHPLPRQHPDHRVCRRDYVLAGAGARRARITVDGQLRVDEELVPSSTTRASGCRCPRRP